MASKDGREQLRAAYAAACQEVEATPDPQLAFQLATVLRDEIDQMVGSAAELRARMVQRVWENEQLSLAALAKRIGVSKSRADQFIQMAKASRADEENPT